MIVLPWPSSSLSGHSKGHWRAHAAETKKHRELARNAALSDLPLVDDAGDIAVMVRFIPPNRRGDRINFPNRMKPYFDGIADALGVNDSRFVPTFIYADPEEPGRVEVEFLL